MSPLWLEELTAALDAIGGFETRLLIAVAVSGGPDSMALMLVADNWARQRGGAAWGLTVDHGLRPESAAEARTVAGWLAERGIPHEVLAWTGDKPRTGIQEAAREARYRLLAEWCRARGVLHLLTAHHRDDQVETHLIRHRAGSGPDGLAGMPAVREIAGCRIVRPLLTVPRARLAAFLAAEGQPFLHDPSNRNPAFERARLRAAPGVPVMEAATEARRFGLQRSARERALDALVGRAVALHPAGFAALDPAVIAAAEAGLVERLLGRVAACIGAARYPARKARIARLRGSLIAEPDRARTLGGCRFVPWRGRILVVRELRAASPPVRLEPGAELLWDRRYAVSLPSKSDDGITVGYLGQAETASPEHADTALPPLIRPVLPAFWDEHRLAAVPHLGYRRAGLAAVPSLSFRPVNRLSSAGFTVV